MNLIPNGNIAGEFHLENGIGEMLHGEWTEDGTIFQITRHQAGRNMQEVRECLRIGIGHPTAVGWVLTNQFKYIKKIKIAWCCTSECSTRKWRTRRSAAPAMFIKRRLKTHIVLRLLTIKPIIFELIYCEINVYFNFSCLGLFTLFNWFYFIITDWSSIFQFYLMYIPD